MKKKNLIILIAGLLLLLIVAALWFLASSQKGDLPPAEDVSTGELYFPSDEPLNDPGAQLSEATGEDDMQTRLNPVTEDAVAAFWFDATDSTLYTVNAAGTILATPFGGSTEVTYGGDGRPFLGALPSTRGDSVLLTTGTRTRPTISLVNAVTGTASFLPQTAQSATWHPNGKDIVFLKMADTKSEAGIALLNTAKKTVSLIAPLKLGEVLLAPYSAQEILVYERPAVDAPSSAWTFNLTTGSLRPLTGPTVGLMVKHYSTGDYTLLYSKKEGLALQTKNASLKLPNTIPQKCASQAKLIYCGVPTEPLQRGPMSYLEKSQYTIDDLFSIDLAGKTTLLWSGKDAGFFVDIFDPVLMGESLYFINRYDNRVYSLSPLRAVRE